MKSKKIIITAILAGGGLIFVLAGFLLLRGVTKFSGALETFNKEKKKLAKYYERDPFPSEGNIEQEVANTEALDAWYEDLLSRLKRSNIESGEDSPSRFIRNYDEAKKRLRKRANESNALIAEAEQFAFGFGRYSGTGELPKQAMVPRLMEQLIVVESLCNVLFDHGIKGLSAIHRDPIDGPVGKGTTGTTLGRPSGRPTGRPTGRPSPSTRPTSTRKSRKKSVKSSAGNSAAAVKPVGTLYTKLHYVIEFKAKESALLGIMNSLSASDMFVVVTSLKIDKTIPELMPAAKAATSGPRDELMPLIPHAFAPPKSKTAEPEETIVQQWEKNKSERKVSGPEFELPMSVTLDLDVYKFQAES